MSQAQRQTEYRYLEDYSYVRQPVAPQETESEELDALGYEEGFGEDAAGDPESSDYASGSTPAEQLQAIQQRVQASGLSPEQQKKLLDELNALAAMPADENFEDELGELEEKVGETIENRGALEQSAEKLKKLKADIQANADLSDREKRDALKSIEAFEKNLAEDPGLQPEDELGELFAQSEEFNVRKEARETEAKRAGGKGAELAAALDKVFQAPTRSASDGNYEEALAAGVVAGSLGVAIGFSSVTVAGYTIAALGGPVAWGIAGAVLGASLVFSETDAPQSKLAGLPPSFQKLDLAMHGESKLEHSKAPGDVVLALYNTKLSAKEQQVAVQKALAGLPVASQAAVLGLAIQTIGDNDPEKLEFLKQYSPEVLGSMRKTIQDGKSQIEGGQLANTGHGDYDVGFNGMEYRINNQDTAWYRNDWNDFGIPVGEMTSPLSDGLRYLEGVSDSAPASASTSTSDPNAEAA